VGIITVAATRCSPRRAVVVVVVFAPERRGGTNEIAGQRHCRPHESLGGASAPTKKSDGKDDAHDREEAGHYREPGQRDRLATIGDLEVDANGPGQRGGEGVVATIAASVAMKPVTASLRSRWVWLVWPDAMPATTPVLFMLFMSFLHPSVTGVRDGLTGM
jgi:hypothetical protein